MKDQNLTTDTIDLGEYAVAGATWYGVWSQQGQSGLINDFAWLRKRFPKIIPILRKKVRPVEMCPRKCSYCFQYK